MSEDRSLRGPQSMPREHGMTGARSDPLAAAAAVFRLAARTFAVEVDPPFYRRLVGMCQHPGPAGPGLVPVEEHLRTAPVPEALEALAVEYCRLFIGPRPACSPYASAHLEGASGGAPARRAIQAVCDEHGIEPRLPPGAPIAADDHAAVALALLAELYAAAAAAGGTRRGSAALAAGARLRDAYLAAWLPRFLAAVERHSRCGPYRPVARVTAALLRDPVPLPEGW